MSSGVHKEYTKITSPFGKRKSPTAGASTFHKGIDVGAPEGTKLYAVCDGKITFANFLGGGGFTITLQADNMKITYCHVSPDFIVEVGDEVVKRATYSRCRTQKCIWSNW